MPSHLAKPSFYARYFKRVLDLIASGFGLLFLLPIFIVLAIWVKLSSKGPVIFKHERLGLRHRPIQVYKFRSMTHGAKGAEISTSEDARITSAGRVLRRYKLDELPQLWNVFVGDMSLVGPRPEVQRYVDMFAEDYKEVLSVRPGITDYAAVNFANEAEVLEAADDPEALYCQEILPQKIQYYKKYIADISLRTDLRLIFRTVFRSY